MVSNDVVLYFVCAIAVGLAQLVSSWHLMRGQGRPNQLVYVVSTVELGWTVVCGLVWYRGTEGIASWHPALFLAYVAFSTGYAVHRFGRNAQAPGQTPAQSARSVQLTPVETLAFAAFDLVYLLSSVYCLLALT